MVAAECTFQWNPVDTIFSSNVEASEWAGSVFEWCTPRFIDSSNLRLLQKLLIGTSIHASFTDWVYLDLAMAVHLFQT